MTSDSSEVRHIVDSAVGSARPQEQFPQTPAANEETLDQDGTSRFLNRLMYRSPFMDSFVRSAERTNTGRTSESRVRAHKRDHPTLFLVVFWLDLLLRIVVVGALVTVAVLILWKAIAPIPPLFDQPESQPSADASP